jgi:hypothetical protein
VVLSAVLVSTGVGSLLSRRLRGPRSLGFVLVPVVLLLVASAWLLEPLLRSVEHAGPIVKILLTLALTTPVFLPLGMVFPTLLRRTTRSLYPWMMGVNSITSLAGGTVALVVALTLGYRMVMLVGTLAYLLLIGILLTRTVGATPE